MLAVLFALATALVVLFAYLVAEMYLSGKGWLVALPDGRALAHVRMRNLLLLVGTPSMAVLGFAVGWFSHVAPVVEPVPETAAGPEAPPSDVDPRSRSIE